MTDKPLSSVHARDVHGFCPACGNPTLRLGDDGRIVCTLMDCPRPDLVNELIGDVADARTHAAYTFCSQLVGHVTMTAFAKKITEKVTAVGQRKEAVAYANEQKRRAEQLEELLTVAHQTSNTAETERARLAAEVERLGDWCRAVSARATTAETERDRYHGELVVNETDHVAATRRAERAEAAIGRVQDAAALHRKQLVSTAELYAVIEAALDEQREQSARTTANNSITSSDEAGAGSPPPPATNRPNEE